MERKRFRVGSIAVLFAVVVFCVAIFSTLTVVTAMGDLRTARRYADHVTANYACEDLGQQWLARADGYLAGEEPLPENTWESEGKLGTEITRGDTTLTVCLQTEGSRWEILRWECRTDWTPENSWNLWQ